MSGAYLVPWDGLSLTTDPRLPGADLARVDRNSYGPGRPAKREGAKAVRAFQSLLSNTGPWGHPSSVTGRRLTDRGCAYLLWRRTRRYPAGYHGVWAPPGLIPDVQELERLETEALMDVLRSLLAKVNEHNKRLLVGEAVTGLRMRPPADRVPTDAIDRRAFRIAPSRDGLPGLYSEAWPTPLGLRGDARLEDAERLVAAEPQRFELVNVEPADLQELRVRLRSSYRCIAASEAPLAVADEVAIAEHVAGRFRRGETCAAEKYVRRVVEEARTWEYQHLRSSHITGRKPLPPVRSSSG